MKIRAKQNVWIKAELYPDQVLLHSRKVYLNFISLALRSFTHKIRKCWSYTIANGRTRTRHHVFWLSDWFGWFFKEPVQVKGGRGREQQKQTDLGPAVTQLMTRLNVQYLGRQWCVAREQTWIEKYKRRIFLWTLWLLFSISCFSF